MKWLIRILSSVPELMDLSKEPDSTFNLHGEEARGAGSFSACCLNASRLAKCGVQNIQIFFEVGMHKVGFIVSMEISVRMWIRAVLLLLLI